MVKRLMDYKWSSYPYYAYSNKQLPRLNTDQIPSLFGRVGELSALYRKKVQAYSDETELICDKIKTIIKG